MKIKHKNFKIKETDAPLLEKLSAAHRDILELAASNTYEEMAGALAVNLGTMRSRLNRARTALQALREKQGSP